MHPDLLNNSIFLRYYNTWQADPHSIVFAPIAEYLQLYGMFDDAIRICEAGLKNHPRLISGRLALAKAYMRKKEWPKAEGELRFVLKIIPNQEKALEFLKTVERELLPAEPEKKTATWETVTMAKIYAMQGHTHRAREVYKNILNLDPSNEEAVQGLEHLEGEV
ncbi:MAG: hypothetical protein Q7T03_06650 [Deltaproteobacteria bacterium]|nr:hypothetical protein [Deltaproteobacteria bacterium]